MPSTDENGVQTVCEKVRSATEELRIPLAGGHGEGQELRITVSGGGVILPTISENGVDMVPLSSGILEIADRCLYAAKSGGRNRIVTQLATDAEAAQIGADVPVPAPSPVAEG
jgi:GGDEF domain-containing protein